MSADTAASVAVDVAKATIGGSRFGWVPWLVAAVGFVLAAGGIWIAIDRWKAAIGSQAMAICEETHLRDAETIRLTYADRLEKVRADTAAELQRIDALVKTRDQLVRQADLAVAASSATVPTCLIPRAAFNTAREASK